MEPQKYLSKYFWRLRTRIRKLKWGASSRWLSSLYCPKRNLDQMAIGKMHPTLVFKTSVQFSWSLFLSKKLVDCLSQKCTLASFWYLSVCHKIGRISLKKQKKLFSIDFGGCAIWTRVLIDIFISFIGHIRSLGVINFMFYWNRYIDLYLNLTGKSHLMDFQNSFNSCVGFLTILSKRVFLPFPSPKLGPPDWASRLGLQSRPKFFKSQRNC